MGLQRKAVKSFTLSDGTFIPESTTLNVSSTVNCDPKVYEDPITFNPWRFCDDQGERRTAARVTSDYWLWGRGRHACPGRFFAVLEVKSILARMLMAYDIRITDGQRPADKISVYQTVPDPMANIILRRRIDEKVRN